MKLNSTLLNRGLLFFWAIWFSLVFGSDLVDGMQAAGFAPASWSFASGNFELVAKTVSIYGLPGTITAILFLGILAVALAATILFWRAAVDSGSIVEEGMPKVYPAFVAGGGLFAGFLIADELFLSYMNVPGLTSTHWFVLGTLLLTLLVLRQSRPAPR